MDTYKNVVMLRQTDTGSLHSLTYYAEDLSRLVDEDGQTYEVPPCSRFLVIWDKECRSDWLERHLDAAELMLHAGHSAKFTGAAIKTKWDVRTAGRRYVVGGEEEIPF